MFDMPRYTISKGRIVVNEADGDVKYPIEYAAIYFNYGYEVFVYPKDQSNPLVLKSMVGYTTYGQHIAHKVRMVREVTYQGMKGLYMTSDDFDAWETNGGNRLKMVSSKMSKNVPPYNFHIDYTDRDTYPLYGG